MTSPTTRQRFGHSSDTDDSRVHHAIDLLEESPTTVTDVVVRNQPLTRVGAFAAAILLGGLIWLLAPAPDRAASRSPILDDTSQQTTVASVAEQQAPAAGAESPDPSASVDGAGFPSLLDRVAQDVNDWPLTTDETSIDETFPLGTPHE